MNDIASASDKGRRTIYTYFKSKRDIFNAVIERETDHMLGRLRMIVANPAPPEEKFAEYIECRFETMRELVSRNGTLRAGFFRDFRKVERARRLLEKKETALLCEILQEGVAQGVFRIPEPHKTAVIVTQMMQGFDAIYLRDSLADQGLDQQRLKSCLTDLLLNGLV